MLEENKGLDSDKWATSAPGKRGECTRLAPDDLLRRVRRSNVPWLFYVYGLGLVVSGTLLSALVHQFFSPANLVMIYLLAVVVAAVYLGRGPSVLVAILSVLAFNFFFTPPRLTFLVENTEYLFTFLVLFVVGLVVSNLMALTREQSEAAKYQAAQNSELYTLSRDLAVAVSLDEIMQAILTRVGQTFDVHSAIFLHLDGKVKPQAFSPEFTLGEDELKNAIWTFRNSQTMESGIHPETAESVRYLPLRTACGVIGVLAIQPSSPASRVTPDRYQLLDTFVSQAALAIERAELAEQARQAEVLAATEKLHKALLNSISHDLRTPLVSIIGALSSLQEDDGDLDVANRHSLVENAIAEAERLNRLVGNLLDIARIEGGGLKVMREPCDVEDLIGAAVEQLDSRLRQRSVVIDVPPDMPLVSMDFVLMKQVLVNLIENALKYSPQDTPIEIRAGADETRVFVEVADRGIGIPAEDLNRVFDKFYRVQQPHYAAVSGTGLGLFICKGIVDAHGGHLWAQNREYGGTIMNISLPRDAVGEMVK